MIRQRIDPVAAAIANQRQIELFSISDENIDAMFGRTRGGAKLVE